MILGACVFVLGQGYFVHTSVEGKVIGSDQAVYLAPTGWTAVDKYEWHPLSEKLPIILSFEHRIDAPDRHSFVRWGMGSAGNWTKYGDAPEVGVQAADEGSDMVLKLFKADNPRAKNVVVMRERNDVTSLHVQAPGSTIASNSSVTFRFDLDGLSYFQFSEAVFQSSIWPFSGGKAGSWAIREFVDFRSPVTSFGKNVPVMAKSYLSEELNPTWQNKFDGLLEKNFELAVINAKSKLPANTNAKEVAHRLMGGELERRKSEAKFVRGQCEDFLKIVPLPPYTTKSATK